MHIKITANTDFPFDDYPSYLIKDASALTKRASPRLIMKYAKTPGQVDLHIIALGAYEGVGFNRNVDGFMEKDCEANHGYFVKAARAVHRHHRNKPGDPKYGNIKASAYNPAMRRVELIVGLDEDKCADILDEQEKRGYTSWSMASKQAYDICSTCGHKAKDDKTRCSHIPDKLGEIDDDGVMTGMINPDPHWFEISYVKRPADRIGVSLSKCAANACFDTRPRTTADEYRQMYPDLYVPGAVIVSKEAEIKRELIKKLSEMEKYLDAVAKKPETSKDKYLVNEAPKINATEGLSASTLEELRKVDPKKLFKMLADKGIILAPEDFSKYLFNDEVNDKEVAGMKSHLPSVFSDMDDDDKSQVSNDETFSPSMSSVMPPGIRNLIEKLVGGHSLLGDPVSKRIIHITIMSPGKQVKTSMEKTSNAKDHALARVYANYKLATLAYMQDKEMLDENTLWYSLIQNR